MYAAAQPIAMPSTQPHPGLVAGRILSSLAVLFLTFDAVAKLLMVRQVIEATAQLGFPAGAIPVVGAVLLLSTVVYAIPRTAVVGAVLLTGFLGGAIAVQLRVGNPLFETTFPLIVAALVWGGLVLRDPRLLAVLRPRRAAAAH